MENQFADEPLEQEPDISKEYYVSPITKSKGLTHLMKLVLCVKNNDNCVGMIKKIIDDDPKKINEQCDKGWTPLMIACRNSNTHSSIEVVKLLLDHSNIDVNKQSNSGWTSLMYACRNSSTDSNIETVELLLNRPDIDVNKRETDGWSALMMAATHSCGGSNVETVKLLLGHPKINVNDCGNDGYTALMMACINVGSKDGSDIKTVELLLDHPDIDINKYDNFDRSSINIGYICIDCKIINKIYEKFIQNSNAFIDRKNMETIIDKSDDSIIDLLLSRLLNPLIFDRQLMAKMILKCENVQKLIYYCNLHTNVKPNMLKKIYDHKEEIYGRPNNMIALCSEINFYLKFKDAGQVFEELDDKLKFIFDIKNESDMVNKISFYL